MFHYTNLYALRSIVENKKIRMTDYRFLNDSDEYKKGIYFFCKAFEDFDEYPSDCPFELKESIKTALFVLNENGLGGGFFERSIFVSSFSKSRDSLSQWRNYGLYSIEFDCELLCSEKNHPNLTAFMHCYYYHSEVDGVGHARSKISKDIVPYLISYSAKNSNFGIESLIIDLIISYSLCFKHAAFKYEDEVRLVSLIYLEGYSGVLFRERGDILIPYVELSFKSSAIKGIMLGPSDNQDLAFISLSAFSQLVNSQRESELYDITVDRSKLPYRG